MKRVLVDINVILDVLLDRAPHLEMSVAVWSAIESAGVEGLLAAHAVTTIHYLMERDLGPSAARRSIASLLRVFGVAPVDRAILQQAMDLSFTDFEDAVTAAAAASASCEGIITRDLKDFRNSPVRAISPRDALPLLRRK